MNRRPPHHEPVGVSLWRERRVKNIATANAALRSHAATVPIPPTVAHRLYVEFSGCEPGAVMGYGIDHKGPWARVGDARARARTPEAALAAALAKHQETTR